MSKIAFKVTKMQLKSSFFGKALTNIKVSFDSSHGDNFFLCKQKTTPTCVKDVSLEIDSTMLKSSQNVHQCWLLCLHPKIIKTSHRNNFFLDLIAMFCLAIICQNCIMDKMWFMIFKTYPSFCCMDHFRWNPNLSSILAGCHHMEDPLCACSSYYSLVLLTIRSHVSKE